MSEQLENRRAAAVELARKYVPEMLAGIEQLRVELGDEKAASVGKYVVIILSALKLPEEIGFLIGHAVFAAATEDGIWEYVERTVDQAIAGKVALTNNAEARAALSAWAVEHKLRTPFDKPDDTVH